MKKLIIMSLIVLMNYAQVQAESLILDGRTIPLNSSNPVTIDSATGNIIATSANGDLTCAEVGDPPTLSLSLSPTTINTGESSTISWTVGNNATSCIKGGSWSGVINGSNVTNGLHSTLLTNITDSSTYTLRCLNGFGDSPVRSTSVTVNGGNPNCTSQPPILGGNEDFSIIPDPVPLGSNQGTYDGTYDDLADGVGYPGIYGSQVFFSLTKNRYIAMEFTTDNTDAKAKLVFTTPSNSQGAPTNATTVAISECPGDFTTHLNQTRCLSIGGAVPNLRWSQNPSTSSVTHCLLDKNKTYYLNIVHSNSAANGYSTSACTSNTYCGGIFSHTNEN